jgi:aminomethyltransferase
VSSKEEHLATRRAAGLFDFSFMGLYELSSIEGVQSRDLANFEPGQIAYTLLLNDDGSVFNDATAWRMDVDRWWLFTGRRSDFERLRGIARDRSGEYAVLALQGPASGRILARLIDADTVRGLRYFHFVQLDSLLVARLGYSGELGYELMVPPAEEPRLRSRLLDAGHTDGLCEASFEAANSLRIESGYVLFDREIDGRANPRELGLERLVSTPGLRFSLSKLLVGLEFADRPPRADLPVAHVTSECFSPTLERNLALGFVPSDAASTGTAVRLKNGRSARVARLPFYDPGRRLPRSAPL